MKGGGKRRRGTPSIKRDPPACPVDHKKSFDSRKDARMFVGRVPHAKQAYKCRHCPYWHTTSSRTRNPALRKNRGS